MTQLAVPDTFQQKISNYFTTTQNDYLVVSFFGDGGPQYFKWSIENY